jgi:hypothetical protein
MQSVIKISQLAKMYMMVQRYSYLDFQRMRELSSGKMGW